MPTSGAVAAAGPADQSPRAARAVLVCRTPAATAICGDVRQPPWQSEVRVEIVKTIPTSPSLSLKRALQNIRAWDDSRDSFPGEHWLVLTAGVALLLAASQSSSPVKRIAGAALGGALLYRAASGRDGVARLLRQLPPSRGLLR